MPPNTPQSGPKKSPPLFTNRQINAIYVTLGCFVASSLGALLVKVTGVQFFSYLEFAWLFGAVVGFGTIVASFVGGLVSIFEDKGVMFASSIILVIGIFIVGNGTCAFNIGSFN